tara:strand:+ start:4009 stop:4653 length:645 start_codon:yes stop_codon:yes gene_type:complete
MFPKMKPIKLDDDGTPMFTNIQIDDYGLPEHWGYETYRVIESREANFVTDYKMEQERYFRKIHRYCRLSRFKTCLLNLLGERGKIPPSVMMMIRVYLKPDSKDKWNDARRILKLYKQRRYYDNIPIILKQLNYGRLFKAITSEQLENIVNDFKCLSSRFEETKTTRRYFPNIRFIVLKLLEQHGIEQNYPIPLARTSRKLKSLNQLWDSLLYDK